MGRLRYNGLRGTLAGGMASSTSGVASLSAALTHSDGTNVPTVASPDVLPLTFLDSSGLFQCIHYVTAYTAAATSATFSGPKEGTTCPGHASGDKFVCSPGVGDFFQGDDRFSNRLDNLWAVGDLGYDVEFDTDGTSLPSGWSWVNQGTSTYEQSGGKAILTPQASGSDRHAMIIRNLPTESTWKAYAALGLYVPQTNWYRLGLVLRRASSGKFTLFGRMAGGSGDWFLATGINDWNSETSFSGGEAKFSGCPGPYFRITKNASTWDFHSSPDGIVWTPLVIGKTAFDTYDQIGLAVHGVSALPMSVDWFRVRV